MIDILYYGVSAHQNRASGLKQFIFTVYKSQFIEIIFYITSLGPINLKSFPPFFKLAVNTAYIILINGIKLAIHNNHSNHTRQRVQTAHNNQTDGIDI